MMILGRCGGRLGAYAARDIEYDHRQLELSNAQNARELREKKSRNSPLPCGMTTAMRGLRPAA
jgi:hypothetical protein